MSTEPPGTTKILVRALSEQPRARLLWLARAMDARWRSGHLLLGCRERATVVIALVEAREAARERTSEKFVPTEAQKRRAREVARQAREERQAKVLDQRAKSREKRTARAEKHPWLWSRAPARLAAEAARDEAKRKRLAPDSPRDETNGNQP